MNWIKVLWAQVRIDWLDTPLLRAGNWELTLGNLLRLILLPVVAVIVARWIRRTLRRALNRRQGIEPEVQNPISTVVYYVVLALGIFTALSAAGLPMQNIAVFSGAIGLGIGLGLQQVAQNFICGLILLLTKPIRAGDWIERGDIEGEVLNVGIYSTIIQTLDDADVVIPNSVLVNAELINWTRDVRRRRVLVPLGVAYRSDMHQVRDILIQVAKDHPDVLDDPAPSVWMTGYGASSVDFNMVVWTAKQVTTPPLLRSELYYGAWDALAAANVEIPFQQTDIWFRNAPPHPVNVKVEDGQNATES